MLFTNELTLNFVPYSVLVIGIEYAKNWQIDLEVFIFVKNTAMSVIKLTIIDRNNVAHEIEAPTDMSMNIMELCKANDLPVEGTCGGMALCASCQCYLESETLLPEQSDAELDMLDQAFFVKNNSRLGCQIQISEELNGVVLRLAPEG